MDEMQDWEVSLLADNLNFAMKDEWEMTRWIVCSVLRPHLKKSHAEKPMTDLFPLPTDKVYDDMEKEITNQQVEVMKHRIDAVSKIINKKKK